MATYDGNRGGFDLDAEIGWIHSGRILTDSSGDVVNVAREDVADATEDDFGDPLLFPLGIENIEHTDTGEITITLEKPWVRLKNYVINAEVKGDFVLTSQNPTG